jgi:hypothetical protein
MIVQAQTPIPALNKRHSKWASLSRLPSHGCRMGFKLATVGLINLASGAMAGPLRHIFPPYMFPLRRVVSVPAMQP